MAFRSAERWDEDSTQAEKPEDQEFFNSKWMSLDALAEQTWEVRRPIYRKLALHINVLKQTGKRTLIGFMLLRSDSAFAR